MRPSSSRVSASGLSGEPCPDTGSRVSPPEVPLLPRRSPARITSLASKTAQRGRKPTRSAPKSAVDPDLRPLPYPELFAFVGSACLLALELVAFRILAPVIGVSLYTWTSVIGVVLAGISLGNYLGGRIADRWPRRQTLGVLLA